jgi:hypothetical protein
MRYFAEIDQDDTIVAIIVSDQEFINSGEVGNPANWVETFNDGTRKQMASIGGRWDYNNNVFISRCKYPSWNLNSNFDWEPPIKNPNPRDGGYLWNEYKQEWIIPEEE